MCKDVRNSYIVHKLGIQRVPYDIRNYAVMRVFGIFLWGSPLKCHGDIMRVYDFKRLGTLYMISCQDKIRYLLKRRVHRFFRI